MRDPGYRDRRDADVQRGICPDCGTYITNLAYGEGGRCPLCHPPVREYRFACGTTLVTDDDPYCPVHVNDPACRIVSSQRLRPPRQKGVEACE